MMQAWIQVHQLDQASIRTSTTSLISKYAATALAIKAMNICDRLQLTKSWNRAAVLQQYILGPCGQQTNFDLSHVHELQQDLCC